MSSMRRYGAGMELSVLPIEEGIEDPPIAADPGGLSRTEEGGMSPLHEGLSHRQREVVLAISGRVPGRL